MKAIARYGEIFLKGKNKINFEKKLVENIKLFYKRENLGVGVLRKRNRLLVEAEDFSLLKNVFGLISYSPVEEVELDLDLIKEKVLFLIQDKKFETFAIAAKRMSTKFELNSQQINEQVGEFVLENLKKKVDLKNPDLLLGIELIDGMAYIFTETVDCFGGLPVGVEGEAVLLMGDRQSILAGLLMMKRGCDLRVVGFNDFDILLLQKFSPRVLELEKIKTLKELEGKIVVSLSEVEGAVVLNPLCGLSEEEMEIKVRLFENG